VLQGTLALRTGSPEEQKASIVHRNGSRPERFIPWLEASFDLCLKELFQGLGNGIRA